MHHKPPSRCKATPVSDSTRSVRLRTDSDIFLPYAAVLPRSEHAPKRPAERRKIFDGPHPFRLVELAVSGQ